MLVKIKFKERRVKLKLGIMDINENYRQWNAIILYLINTIT